MPKVIEEGARVMLGSMPGRASVQSILANCGYTFRKAGNVPDS
ncbi:hypothetical protein NBRC111894_1052 [Sporolactobacillus inulinus]|uniref:Uncharacterized protein n=1 Tax=Sporolactobacillus inulinus TaxID=2078 RepID=A0A4Y1Z9H2_9BACL|nr:hypothetical protein NBRC111894_1052 [Sporolactobacillus inulinus]